MTRSGRASPIGPAGQLLDQVQRLVDEELLQPQQVADVERLAEARG